MKKFKGEGDMLAKHYVGEVVTFGVSNVVRREME